MMESLDTLFIWILKDFLALLVFFALAVFVGMMISS